jgi:hypothetical protein
MELLSFQTGKALYLQATGVNNLIILATGFTIKLYAV